MSLRQITKILGVSHTLLSLMKNVKREWRPHLKERYEGLVTSLPESGYTEAKTESLNSKNDGNTVTRWQYGGAEEARTPDPLLAKQVLSQLSYSPTRK